MNIEFLIVLSAGMVSASLCAALIPLLRKIKAGQYILGYVKEHEAKSGTPTMGGVAFISAIALVSAFFGVYADKRAAVSITLALAYMVVGFLDDFIKIRFKRNLGLKAYQKIAFQLIIAVIAGLFCYFNKITTMYIPFTGFSVDLGLFFVPMAALVFIAAVNSVNLTDGLDGLAGGTSLSYFFIFGILLTLQGAGEAMELLCFCIVGALGGYLIFNTNKASVFMGDTGSLSLGGLVASVSVFTGNLLYIAIIGIMFVLSSISVIVQVIYYKKTKRRIFLMAPLHHHFQMKGHAESKIVYAYSAITIALGLLCLCFV